jgi:hypothetical protein
LAAGGEPEDVSGMAETLLKGVENGPHLEGGAPSPPD